MRENCDLTRTAHNSDKVMKIMYNQVGGSSGEMRPRELDGGDVGGCRRRVGVGRGRERERERERERKRKRERET